jgi:uncharacterized protein
MKFLLIDILKFYKAYLSPFLPSACRFEPTCSVYMMQAVEKFGVFRGTWKGQPFCAGGYDPVK